MALRAAVQMPQVFLTGWGRSARRVTGRWEEDEPSAEPQKPAGIPRFQESLLWFASCSLAINAALSSWIQEQRSGDLNTILDLFICVFMVSEPRNNLGLLS